MGVIDLDKAKKFFKQLYKDVDGRALSLKERDDKQLSSKSFVYGEVVPESFYDVIKEANPQPGSIFYDLGSGTGKAVILAHLLFDFPKVVGVELLEGLYNASVQMQKQYEEEFRPKVEERMHGKIIELRLGSILDTDISDADFIFMNSTCFQDDLMEEIEKKLEDLRPNATVITLSKAIRSPAFYQEKHKLFEFSWGQATAFYHRKLLWKVYM
jgi:SAM-dependent methyltransferase